MLFLLKLVRIGLFLLLALLWFFYGSALFNKLVYPNYKNLDSTGFFVSGLLLTVFSVAILSNFRKDSK
jgi:uncharacterized membrane protein YiaA